MMFDWGIIAGLIGLVLLLVGTGLCKLFGSWRKMNRPRLRLITEEDIWGKMYIILTNLDVYIPIGVQWLGIICVLVSAGLFFIGLLECVSAPSF